MDNLIIPPEIIREIARSVDDVPTLLSGSLVCKHLSRAFQEFLFSKVYLYHQEISLPAIQYFYNTANGSPNLLSHIRSFSISVIRSSDLDMLIQILSSTSNIRNLFIQKFFKSISYPVDKLTTLSSIIPTHPLEEIHLHYLQFLSASFLKQCRQLKCLSLIRPQISYDDLPFLEPNEQPIQLDILQVNCMNEDIEDVAQWLLHQRCPFDVGIVKTLCLDSENGFSDLERLWYLVLKCAQSVETLRFEVDRIFEFNVMIDFSAFPKLRSIELRLSEYCEDMIFMIEHAFRNIYKGTSIQNIILEFPVFENDIESGEDRHWIYDIFAFSKRFTESHSLIVTMYESTPGIESKIHRYIERAGLGRFKNIEIEIFSGVLWDTFCGYSGHKNW